MTHKFLLSVPGMSCGHCEVAITEAVSALANVESVRVDLDAKTVHVAGGETAAIVAAVGDAGYDVESIRAEA
ncbi:MAG: heavy-metal-associated domain-containing protein [Actinobacteria bacterium]|nr:heavy-metal-associated domain-containing protein [Actinomycetota bacterium]MCB9388293.1 heavy-metal-associated domain-containing protein [Acidimicrobiia bacterium]